ncbi:unnamed protein product [Brassica rapa]|uniref:F-box domain-containing protein n=5 Tax=Brassica TaxID=3705 RepID=A0A8D9GQ31_BRACM|nr:unnamed protein product [Brassica rapa]
MISDEVEPTKKKKTVPEPPSMFSSLPDEIIENILARISRWNYPSLSLVSKRFHSLLSSMDIYRARSQIGSNETCLYIWLKLPGHPCASWFSVLMHKMIVIKHLYYLLYINHEEPFSSVRIFDCRSHTWRDAPNMTVAREDAQTVLLDEKIYVMGGCDIDKYNANWIEVFDVN